MAGVIDRLPITRRLGSRNHTARRGFPWGLTGHYDASLGTDEAALRFFTSPDCGTSYDLISTDEGELVAVHDYIPERFAWHNGVCARQPGEIPDTYARTDIYGRPIVPPYLYGKANEGYIGISCTTGGVRKGERLGTPATTRQALTIALTMAVLYDEGILRWGWRLDELDRRIRGHEELAIYNPRDNPGRPDLWGKLGRKNDPTGNDPRRPILSMDGTRQLVRQLLTQPATLEAIAGVAGWEVPTITPR